MATKGLRGLPDLWITLYLLACLSHAGQTFQVQNRPAHFVPRHHRRDAADTLFSRNPLGEKSQSVVVAFAIEGQGRGPVDNSTTDKSLVRMVLKAIGKSTTIAVAGTFFLALAWFRDGLMVSFFIGSVSNAIVSKILKRIINQARPPELEKEDLKVKPSDNGMPSSHAMSLGFIATFTALCIPLPWAKVILAGYAVISLIYRVHVNLHTWQQVVVGSILGSVNGYTWFHLCTGDNPWSINVVDTVSSRFLDETGHLPVSMLIFPALVGAATVSSVERRISAWLKNGKRD